jgi:hypothetical protein
MKNMEKHKALANEQYGGRNGHSAIDVVLLKEFTLGILHLKRYKSTVIDCDAKACYHRILAVLVALVYFKAGLALSVCTLFARALKQMKFYMVTAFGVSEQYNQHSNETPSYGIGQGATDGPPGWTGVSDIIIKSHNSKAHRSILEYPAKTIKVKRSADMFIDNASLTVNDSNPQICPRRLSWRKHRMISLVGTNFYGSREVCWSSLKQSTICLYGSL